MFNITDDNLIAVFEDMGRDHDATLNKVLQICRQANLEINKEKCLFSCTSIPFFGEIIPQSIVSPVPRKVQALMALPLPKCKKEFQSFLGIINYFSTFTPMTAEVCEPLWKLTSAKTEWSWNSMYQDLYEKAKNVNRHDTCMILYDALKPLYLETDT